MGHLVYPLEGRPCALETAALSEPLVRDLSPLGVAQSSWLPVRF